MSRPRRTQPKRRTVLPPAAAASASVRREILADWARLIGDRIAGRESAARSVPPDDAVHPTLTPRLKQTLELLLAGDGEKQVAIKLGISRHTVHTYVKQLYSRYEVSSRAELLARFVRPSGARSP